MTQKGRVLELLKKRGQNGITQVDFLAPWVADGGKPITRLAARVLELRDAGFNIENRGTRNGCVVYVLADPVIKPREEQILDATIDRLLKDAA